MLCVLHGIGQVAVHKHCTQTGNLLYICNADDIVGGLRVELNMEQKAIVVSMKLADNKKTKGTKKLGYRIEIAIGKYSLTLSSKCININVG